MSKDINLNIINNDLIPYAIASSIMSNSPKPKTQEELDVYIVKFINNAEFVRKRLQYYDNNPDKIDKIYNSLKN